MANSLALSVDIGVLIGIALAMAQHFRREQQLIFQHWMDAERQVLHCQPLGVLSLGSAPFLEAELLEVPPMVKSWVTRIWHLGASGSEVGAP